MQLYRLPEVFGVRIPCRRADSRFTLLSGILKEYVKTAESGGRRIQAFCPDCGTHLYSTSVGDGPKVLRIRTSTANQRNLLVPRKQGWMRSAQR